MRQTTYGLYLFSYLISVAFLLLSPIHDNNLTIFPHKYNKTVFFFIYHQLLIAITKQMQKKDFSQSFRSLYWVSIYLNAFKQLSGTDRKTKKRGCSAQVPKTQVSSPMFVFFSFYYLFIYFIVHPSLWTGLREVNNKSINTEKSEKKTVKTILFYVSSRWCIKISFSPRHVGIITQGKRLLSSTIGLADHFYLTGPVACHLAERSPNKALVLIEDSRMSFEQGITRMLLVIF